MSTFANGKALRTGRATDGSLVVRVPPNSDVYALASHRVAEGPAGRPLRVNINAGEAGIRADEHGQDRVLRGRSGTTAVLLACGRLAERPPARQGVGEVRAAPRAASSLPAVAPRVAFISAGRRDPTLEMAVLRPREARR